jgi:adenosyl cobinamide kinase/adenosyl cobinamide phosphate guanylyltransferase
MMSSDQTLGLPHRIILTTGPARSGKSEWAEALARQSGKAVIYVATSTVDPADQDWQSRIAQHRQRRPADWQLWEVPVALGSAIAAAREPDCLLIDSLVYTKSMLRTVVLPPHPQPLSQRATVYTHLTKSCTWPP